MKYILLEFLSITVLVTLFTLPIVAHAQDGNGDTQKSRQVDLLAECAQKQFTLYQQNHGGSLPQGADLDQILDLCLFQAEIIPLYLQTGQQISMTIAPAPNVIVPNWHSVTHPWLPAKTGK